MIRAHFLTSSSLTSFKNHQKHLKIYTRVVCVYILCLKLALSLSYDGYYIDNEDVMKVDLL